MYDSFFVNQLGFHAWLSARSSDIWAPFGTDSDHCSRLMVYLMQLWLDDFLNTQNVPSEIYLCFEYAIVDSKLSWSFFEVLFFAVL